MPKRFNKVLECVPERDSHYRWLMVRQVNEMSTEPVLVVIQMNSSTASADRNDPTCGKVAEWARRNGFGRVVYLNLFGRRGPHPEDIAALTYEEMVGDWCDHYIGEGIAEATSPEDKIVMACGGPPEAWGKEIFDRRLCEVKAIIGERSIYHVGALRQDGYPRHGLMWNGNPELHEWDWGVVRHICQPRNGERPL